MSHKGYFAIRLTTADVLSGQVPDKYSKRSCLMCEDIQDAKLYLGSRDESDYLGLFNLTMPAVGVIYSGVSKTVDIQDATIEPTRVMQDFLLTSSRLHVEAGPLHQEVEFGAHEISKMQTCALSRAAVTLEYARIRENYPMAGMKSWYRAIATTDPETQRDPIAAELHAPVFAREMNKAAEEFQVQTWDKEAHVAIDIAMIRAAEFLSQNPSPYVAQTFQEVAQIARDVLREDAKTDFVQSTYMNNILSKMPEELMQEFASAFHQNYRELSHAQPDNPLIYCEAQAMYQALETMAQTHEELDELQEQAAGVVKQMEYIMQVDPDILNDSREDIALDE